MPKYLTTNRKKKNPFSWETSKEEHARLMRERLILIRVAIKLILWFGPVILVFLVLFANFFIK